MLDRLHVKIFSDGAGLEDFRRLNRHPRIKGFTTNPTLMKAAGVEDYQSFVLEVVEIVRDKPISFEVTSDDFDVMAQQALWLSRAADNVYVKIPVTNTRGDSSAGLIDALSHEGVKVNVTAILSLGQVETAAESLSGGAPAVISVFAGRVADTGVDPLPLMKEAGRMLRGLPGVELLWASPRELLNIFHAEEASCDIITVQPGIIEKLDLVGYSLSSYSLDTVRMFYEDALKSGYMIDGSIDGYPARRPARAV